MKPNNPIRISIEEMLTQEMIRDIGADHEDAAVCVTRICGELRRTHELLNTPELRDFAKAVVLEAAHQRERWPAEHDAGKQPEDWFWLIGYLAGKALHAQKSGNSEKALHHTISTAATLANWHAAMTGEHTAMRPGIAQPATA